MNNRRAMALTALVLAALCVPVTVHEPAQRPRPIIIAPPTPYPTPTPTSTQDCSFMSHWPCPADSCPGGDVVLEQWRPAR